MVEETKKIVVYTWQRSVTFTASSRGADHFAVLLCYRRAPVASSSFSGLLIVAPSTAERVGQGRWGDQG